MKTHEGTNTPPKKEGESISNRIKHPDRVSLSPEAISMLKDWLSEIENRLKGTQVTRSELVNFLILSHPVSLTDGEMRSLEAKYFDEVRFTAWALGQMKEAKSQGRTLTLAEVLKTAPFSQPQTQSEE